MSPQQQWQRTTAHVLSWLIHNTPQLLKGFLVIIPTANIWAFWMFREMIQSSLITKHNCVCWLPWLTAVQISGHPRPGILSTRLNYENHYQCIIYTEEKTTNPGLPFCNYAFYIDEMKFYLWLCGNAEHPESLQILKCVRIWLMFGKGEETPHQRQGEQRSLSLSGYRLNILWTVSGQSPSMTVSKL